MNTKIESFSDLKGHTLAQCFALNGDELHFVLVGGRHFKLYHNQNCCEGVEIESIVGDLADLIGEPLTMAEEATGATPADFVFEYEPESYTWTFYKLATRKGYVDVRWLGSSNGYYSESVDFCEVAGEPQTKEAV
jgi:hypothetical protein